VQTQACAGAIVGDMNLAQDTLTGSRSASALRTTFSRFVDAVYASADDPRPANGERYLAASPELENSRGREEEAP
jgi:hypothetical protein